MDVNNVTDQYALINELLLQNKELRLKIAVLTAQKRFLDDLNKSLQASTNPLTPEIINKISPAALRALQTMEFK